MTHHPSAPDWQPNSSAWRLPEGSRRYGSTGQLFEVRNQQWVRVFEKSGYVAPDTDAA